MPSPAEVVNDLTAEKQRAEHRITATTRRRDGIRRERDEWAEALEALESQTIPEAQAAGEPTAALEADADVARRYRDRLTAALPLAEQQLASAHAELRAVELRLLPARIAVEEAAQVADLVAVAADFPALLATLSPRLGALVARKREIESVERELLKVSGRRSLGWTAWDRLVRDAPRDSSGISILEVLLVFEHWQQGRSVLAMLAHTASASATTAAVQMR